jgi:hypothetical protein
MASFYVLHVAMKGVYLWTLFCNKAAGVVTMANITGLVAPRQEAPQVTITHRQECTRDEALYRNAEEEREAEKRSRRILVFTSLSPFLYGSIYSINGG